MVLVTDEQAEEIMRALAGAVGRTRPDQMVWRNYSRTVRSGSGSRGCS
jgi:hypothetical protein